MQIKTASWSVLLGGVACETAKAAYIGLASHLVSQVHFARLGAMDAEASRSVYKLRQEIVT